MMTPRIRINLAAPGIPQLTRTQFYLKLIVVAGIAFAAIFWWLGSMLQEQIKDIEYQTHVVQTQTGKVKAAAISGGIDLSSRAIKNIPQHISFVKLVRGRVGFSWTQLLSDLETTVPKNIIMSAVSLDEKTNSVLLNGSTPSLQDLNRLIHQLEQHPAFNDVILTQHANKKKKNRKGLAPIIFSMKVAYNPNHLLPKSGAS